MEQTYFAKVRSSRGDEHYIRIVDARKKDAKLLKINDVVKRCTLNFQPTPPHASLSYATLKTVRFEDENRVKLIGGVASEDASYTIAPNDNILIDLHHSLMEAFSFRHSSRLEYIERTFDDFWRNFRLLSAVRSAFMSLLDFQSLTTLFFATLPWKIAYFSLPLVNLLGYAAYFVKDLYKSPFPELKREFALWLYGRKNQNLTEADAYQGVIHFLRAKGEQSAKFDELKEKFVDARRLTLEIEAMQKWATPYQAAEIARLAKREVAKIKKLEIGKSIIIPGSFYSSNVRIPLLYEFIKQENTYTLRLFDPHDTLSHHIKDQPYIELEFSKECVEDPLQLLQPLLELNLPEVYKAFNYDVISEKVASKLPNALKPAPETLNRLQDFWVMRTLGSYFVSPALGNIPPPFRMLCDIVLTQPRKIEETTLYKIFSGLDGKYADETDPFKPAESKKISFFKTAWCYIKTQHPKKADSLKLELKLLALEELFVNEHSLLKSARGEKERHLFRDCLAELNRDYQKIIAKLSAKIDENFINFDIEAAKKRIQKITSELDAIEKQFKQKELTLSAPSKCNLLSWGNTRTSRLFKKSDLTRIDFEPSHASAAPEFPLTLPSLEELTLSLQMLDDMRRKSLDPEKWQTIGAYSLQILKLLPTPSLEGAFELGQTREEALAWSEKIATLQELLWKSTHYKEGSPITPGCIAANAKALACLTKLAESCLEENLLGENFRIDISALEKVTLDPYFSFQTDQDREAFDSALAYLRHRNEHAHGLNIAELNYPLSASRREATEWAGYLSEPASDVKGAFSYAERVQNKLHAEKRPIKITSLGKIYSPSIQERYGQGKKQLQKAQERLEILGDLRTKNGYNHPQVTALRKSMLQIGILASRKNAYLPLRGDYRHLIISIVSGFFSGKVRFSSTFFSDIKAVIRAHTETIIQKNNIANPKREPELKFSREHGLSSWINFLGSWKFFTAQVLFSIAAGIIQAAFIDFSKVKMKYIIAYILLSPAILWKVFYTFLRKGILESRYALKDPFTGAEIICEPYGLSIDSLVAPSLSKNPGKKLSVFGLFNIPWEWELAWGWASSQGMQYDWGKIGDFKDSGKPIHPKLQEAVIGFEVGNDDAKKQDEISKKTEHKIVLDLERLPDLTIEESIDLQRTRIPHEEVFETLSFYKSNPHLLILGSHQEILWNSLFSDKRFEEQVLDPKFKGHREKWAREWLREMSNYALGSDEPEVQMFVSKLAYRLNDVKRSQTLRDQCLSKLKEALRNQSQKESPYLKAKPEIHRFALFFIPNECNDDDLLELAQHYFDALNTEVSEKERSDKLDELFYEGKLRFQTLLKKKLASSPDFHQTLINTLAPDETLKDKTWTQGEESAWYLFRSEGWTIDLIKGQIFRSEGHFAPLPDFIQNHPDFKRICPNFTGKAFISNHREKLSNLRVTSFRLGSQEDSIECLLTKNESGEPLVLFQRKYQGKLYQLSAFDDKTKKRNHTSEGLSPELAARKNSLPAPLLENNLWIACEPTPITSRIQIDYFARASLDFFVSKISDGEEDVLYTGKLYNGSIQEVKNRKLSEIDDSSSYLLQFTGQNSKFIPYLRLAPPEQIEVVGTKDGNPKSIFFHCYNTRFDIDDNGNVRRANETSLRLAKDQNLVIPGLDSEFSHFQILEDENNTAKKIVLLPTTEIVLQHEEEHSLDKAEKTVEELALGEKTAQQVLTDFLENLTVGRALKYSYAFFVSWFFGKYKKKLSVFFEEKKKTVPTEKLTFKYDKKAELIAYEVGKDGRLIGDSPSSNLYLAYLMAAHQKWSEAIWYLNAAKTELPYDERSKAIFLLIDSWEDNSPNASSFKLRANLLFAHNQHKILGKDLERKEMSFEGLRLFITLSEFHDEYLKYEENKERIHPSLHLTDEEKRDVLVHFLTTRWEEQEPTEVHAEPVDASNLLNITPPHLKVNEDGKSEFSREDRRSFAKALLDTAERKLNTPQALRSTTERRTTFVLKQERASLETFFADYSILISSPIESQEFKRVKQKVLIQGTNHQTLLIGQWYLFAIIKLREEAQSVSFQALPKISFEYSNPQDRVRFSLRNLPAFSWHKLKEKALLPILRTLSFSKYAPTNEAQLVDALDTHFKAIEDLYLATSPQPLTSPSLKGASIGPTVSRLLTFLGGFSKVENAIKAMISNGGQTATLLKKLPTSARLFIDTLGESLLNPIEKWTQEFYKKANFNLLQKEAALGRALSYAEKKEVIVELLQALFAEQKDAIIGNLTRSLLQLPFMSESLSESLKNELESLLILFIPSIAEGVLIAVSEKSTEALKGKLKKATESLIDADKKVMDSRDELKSSIDGWINENDEIRTLMLHNSSYLYWDGIFKTQVTILSEEYEKIKSYLAQKIAKECVQLKQEQQSQLQEYLINSTPYPPEWLAEATLTYSIEQLMYAHRYLNETLKSAITDEKIPIEETYLFPKELVGELRKEPQERSSSSHSLCPKEAVDALLTERAELENAQRKATIEQYRDDTLTFIRSCEKTMKPVGRPSRSQELFDIKTDIESLNSFCNEKQTGHLDLFIKRLETEIRQKEESLLSQINLSPTTTRGKRLGELTALVEKTSRFTFEEVTKLWLQGRLYELKNRNPDLEAPEELIQFEKQCAKLIKLKIKLQSHLKAATLANKLRSLAPLQTTKQKEFLETKANLISALNAKRVFDLKTNNRFTRACLLMEMIRGFTLRKDQIETFYRIAKNPTRALQLIMGAGKTDVGNVVLMFVLAMGDNLPILICPRSLFPENSAAIERVSQRYFGTKPYNFQFERNMPLDAERLREILRNLHRATATSSFVMSTRESFQCLRNKWLDHTDRLDETKDNYPQEKEINDLLSQIDSFLRTRGYAYIDEIDTVADVNQQYIFASGELVTLARDPIKIRTAYTVFQTLASDPLLETMIDIRGNNHHNLPPEHYFGYKDAAKEEARKQRFERFAENRFNSKAKPLPPEYSREPIGKIITSKFIDTLVKSNLLPLRHEDDRSTLEGFILGVKTRSDLPHLTEEQEAYIAYGKELIKHVLPSALQKKGNVNYGFEKIEIEEDGKKLIVPGDFVVPYASCDTPRQNSVHGNIFERVAYHLLSYMQMGLSERQITKKRKELLEEANKLAEDYKEGETPAEVEWLKLGWTKTPLRKADDITTKEILEHFKENPTQAYLAALKYATADVLPKLGIYSETLESNAQSFSTQFSFICGASGTTGTIYSLPDALNKKNLTRSEGTDGKTIEAVLRHSTVNKELGQEPLHVLSGQTNEAKTEELIQACQGKNFLVDGGSFLDFTTPKQFAKALLESKPSNSFNDPITAIVYFNENNLWEAISLDKADPFPAEQLGAIDPAKVFTIYDHSHRIGANRAQAAGAKFVLTSDTATKFEDAAQSLLRARGIFTQGQKPYYYLTEESLRSISPEGELKVIDWLIHTMNNQSDETVKLNYKASKQKILNIGQSHVVRLLQSAKTSTERKAIFKFFRSDIFKTHQPGSRSEVVGLLEDEVPQKPRDALRELIKNQITYLRTKRQELTLAQLPSHEIESAIQELEAYKASTDQEDAASSQDRRKSTVYKDRGILADNFYPEEVSERKSEGLEMNMTTEHEQQADLATLPSIPSRVPVPGFIGKWSPEWINQINDGDLSSLHSASFYLEEKYKNLFAPEILLTPNFAPPAGLKDKFLGKAQTPLHDVVFLHDILEPSPQKAWKAIFVDALDKKELFKSYTGNRYEILHYSIRDNNFIPHGNRHEGILENPRSMPGLKELLVQVKFMAGIHHFNEEEKDVLADWITQHGREKEAMVSYLHKVEKIHPSRRKGFEKSVLSQLLPMTTA